MFETTTWRRQTYTACNRVRHTGNIYGHGRVQRNANPQDHSFTSFLTTRIPMRWHRSSRPLRHRVHALKYTHRDQQPRFPRQAFSPVLYRAAPSLPRRRARGPCCLGVARVLWTSLLPRSSARPPFRTSSLFPATTPEIPGATADTPFLVATRAGQHASPVR